MGYVVQRLRDFAWAFAAQRQLRAHERWLRDQLAAHQQAKLGELLSFVSEHSAFYRDRLGGRVDQSEVVLESIPPITKTEWMAALDQVVTDRRLQRGLLEQHLGELEGDDLYLDEFRVMSSGGSSGEPGIFVYDRAGWRWVVAQGLRWLSLIGTPPRLPRWRFLFIGSGSPRHMTFRGGSSLNVGVYDLAGLPAVMPIPDLVAALNSRPPEVIMSYPSVAALLADEQMAGRLDITPEVLCTGSEMRTEDMTERIRRAWGVEPFDCYGLTETGVTGPDCDRHNGIHIFEDLAIIEVVDERGRTVAPGTPGARVLATNLFNRVQPIIRMEVTDLATYTDDVCECGRTLRRLTSLDGRSNDILQLPGARGGEVAIAPAQFFHSLNGIARLSQYQVVRRARLLQVSVVVNRDDARSEVGSALKTALSRLGAADFPIDVRRVDTIDREPGLGGKIKLIKSEVGAPV
jgi:phenylacetate-CoA ligase